MKSRMVFVLCLLSLVSPRDAGDGHRTLDNGSLSPTNRIPKSQSSNPTLAKSSNPSHRSNSPKSSPTHSSHPKIGGEISTTSHPTPHRNHGAIISSTHSSHPKVPKSREKVLTGQPTQKSHSAESFSTHSSHPKVPESRKKVSTGHPTNRSHRTILPPTRSQKTPPSRTTSPKSSHGGQVPTGYPTKPTKTAIRTVSDQKSISGGSSYSTSSNSTTTQKNPGHLPLSHFSASKTLTVSSGHTATAQVGWMVVGFGIGGSVAVGGDIIPVAGGTEGIIVEDTSGHDELSTVDTSTTTSSSSSPTASPTPYNIYPRSGSTSHQQSAFEEHLRQIAHQGSVRSISGSRNKLLLWVASLTPAQASELGRNPVVRGINVDRLIAVDLERPTSSSTPLSPDCPAESCSHQKRDGTILVQRDALEDLKLFSQARNVPLSALPGYAYDSKAGQGITVYVIDTGIDPNHPEFRNMAGSIRWLYVPHDPHVEVDSHGHGTCVASKVTGPTFGVAKNADLVVVGLGDDLHVSRMLAAWGVIAADIASNNMQGRSVVITAVGVKPEVVSPEDRHTYVECVIDLINLDAVVVTASGNNNDMAPGHAIARYPALLASQFGLPIVVVGAVNSAGIYEPYSQGYAPDLTVSAMGTVICADKRGGSSRWVGTSFAAPAVAGLAAYLLSLDQYRAQLQVHGSVARNVRDLIRSLAYARRPAQPAVVWNGIDWEPISCPVRRDLERSQCPAQTPNTTPPLVPPAATPKSKPRPSSSVGGQRTIAVHFSSVVSFSFVLEPTPPTVASGSSPLPSNPSSLSIMIDSPATENSSIETATEGGTSQATPLAPPVQTLTPSTPNPPLVNTQAK